MATATAELTPNALLNLAPPANGGSYELSAGELIVVGLAGARHALTKENILEAFFAWKIQHRLGRVFAESTFTLNSHTARMPDVAIVLNDRAARIPNRNVAIPIAPDVAVEVISPSESAADAEKKVREYLAAGVQEVRQVYSDQFFVRIRRPGLSKDLERDQILTSPVFPNFEMAVSRFFAD